MMESVLSESKAVDSRLIPLTFHSPRDPGGLLPKGIEAMVGEDPVGTVASEEKDEILYHRSQWQTLPATPTRLPPASPQVLAILAGLPPPPPPDTPPPRRRRSKSTPRGLNNENSSSELPSEVSVSIETVNGNDDNGVDEDPVLAVPGGTGKVSNPVVAQGKQITQAVYNGDHLALSFGRQAGPTISLDPPTANDHHTQALIPQNQATPRIIVTVGKEKSKSPLRSPLSIETEPWSNRHHEANPYHDDLLAPVPATVEKHHSRPLSDQPAEPWPHHRSISPERNPHVGNSGSPHHRRNYSEGTMTRDKLSRQYRLSHKVGATAEISSEMEKKKKPRPKTPEVHHRRSKTPDPVDNSRSGRTIATLGISASSESGTTPPEARPPQPQSQSHKPAKKGFFRMLFGGKKNKKIPKMDVNETRVDSDQEKRVPGHPMSTAKAQQQQQLQQMNDQPSGEGGLLLPVYSAELHGDEHMYSDERGSVFFAHDEVSTLTAPTMASYNQKRDPGEENERVSEPMGHYWHKIVGSCGTRDDSGFPSIDPFTEPFFQEPAGISPAPNGSASVDLRVHVPRINDPVGESPLNSHKGNKSPKLPSPQGIHTGPTFTDTPTHDPIGESPLHKHERGPMALLDGTPYAPDPPLYIPAPENEASKSFSMDEIQSARSTPTKETVSDQSSSSSKRVHPPPRPPSPRTGPPLKKPSQLRISPRRPSLRLYPRPMETSKVKSPEASSAPSVTDSGPVDSCRSDATPTDTRLTPSSSEASNRQVEIEMTVSVSPRLRSFSFSPRSGPVDSDAALLALDNRASDHLSISSSTIHSDFSPSNRSISSQPTDEFNRRSPLLEPSTSNLSGSTSTSKTSLQSRVEARRGRSRRLKSSGASPDAASGHVQSIKAPYILSQGRVEEKDEVVAPVNEKSVEKWNTKSGSSKSTAIAMDVHGDDEGIGVLPRIGNNPQAHNKGVGTLRTTRSFSPRAVLRRKAQSSKQKDTLHQPQKNEGDSKDVQQLTISTAARMNAKAVAYLHTINGEPSPRHTWRSPQVSDDDRSPASINLMKRVSTGSRRAETSSDSNLSMIEVKDVPSGANPSPRLFSPYSGKFKGRGLVRKQEVVLANSSGSSSKKMVVMSRKATFWEAKQPFARDVTIKAAAVTAGFYLLRMKRDEQVASGKSSRVVPVRRVKTPKANSYFEAFEDPEPKDPIQRAGQRLLSRAAIPIQSAARRFLAKRRAVDRMWALLEIQSYMRRWRAEASFLASRISATLIQRIFRGSQCRIVLRSKKSAATRIQSIVRCYIYSIQVYEEVYRIILVQALFRRMHCQRQYKVILSTVIKIQASYRRFRDREMRMNSLAAVTKIQAQWRSHLIRTCFQFVVVDIIIAQSVVRRWLARRAFLRVVSQTRKLAATTIQSSYRRHQSRLVLRFNLCSRLVQSHWRRYSAWQRYCQHRSATKIQASWRRISCLTAFREFKAARMIQCNWRCYRDRSGYHRYKCARVLQSAWRGYNTFCSYRDYKGATRIQTAWRGFQAYTDYVFALVDILIIQRSLRRWIATKQVEALRRERAALVLQTVWRRHSSQKLMLVDIMHIIVVQSIARRYLTSSVVNTARQERNDAELAATKLQAAWRRFWRFSHYVILRYETRRLQSLFRGRKARVDFVMTLGCVILIQSRIRQRLADIKTRSLRAMNALFQSQSEALREITAAKRIQFFWRVVLECRREKQAALVIERFFLCVKEEVDREIQRATKRRHSKRHRSHRKQRSHSDCDSSVDQHWLDSLDDHMDVFTFSRSKSSDTASSLSRPSPSSKKGTSVLSSADSLGHKTGIRHRASSPTLNLVMRHDRETKPKPVEKVVASRAKVNGYQPDLLKSRHIRLSLDAAEGPTESSEKYLKMYGVRSAPLRGSNNRHFFEDGGLSIPENDATTTPKSTISGPLSSRSDASNSVNHIWRRLLAESNSNVSVTESSRESPREARHSHPNSSPRHGKILVMKPCPDAHPTQSGSNSPGLEEEDAYLGEDFGMI